jgi:hypothetical protein
MLARGRPDRTARQSSLTWGLDRQAERIRKEPVRLAAENATVASESYAPPDADPVVHASISAPSLKVDIVNRQILTTGLTRLLMIDRRGVTDADTARDAIGVPAALLSRGPSQTAMQCTGRMTYTLGAEGPDRRDTAVFEDQVVFAHRTGKEMVNWEEMLPQIAANREAADQLKNRNATLDCGRLECWFAAEPGGAKEAGGSGLTRSPLKLSSLLASGDVYLRDREDTRIREVNAAWIEFSREEGRIHVRGAEGVDARVYFENAATGQFDVHAGQQLVINLKDGTVRSGQIAGEMRRK